MKKSGIVNKIAALLLTATVAAGASAMSANAAWTTTYHDREMGVQSIQAVNGWFTWKTAYYSVDDMCWLQNLYDGNYSGHAERGGTHSNAGSIEGRCKCTVTYVNSNGKVATKACGFTGKKTGWTETPWVTVGTTDKIVKITGVGQKFTSRSAYTPFIQDTLKVYAAGYKNK